MRRITKYKLDHVAFWLATLLFYAFTRKDSIQVYGWFHFITDVIIRNILIASTCYFNIYILFETFFKKGKYLIYVASLISLIILYAIIQNVIGQQLNYEEHEGFLYNIYYNFSVGIFYLAFTLALDLSKRWYQQQIILHKVQTEKLQAELQYLKAQLNPHFLFNCINSIFFQINRENTEARESLHKFSELLRYQLYECTEDKIPIEKEKMYLENYVDLQRIRKNNNNKIFFNTNENVKDFNIAPLLLLPFVENAFKHVSDHPNNDKIIEVDMNRENGLFIFKVINSINDRSADDNELGIGLKNVRRRLDLLYDNCYILSIQRTATEYSIRLQIEIL